MSEGPYILLRHRTIPELDRLPVYREHGGYRAFQKALTELTPSQVVAEVKASGLRGRGGAGFPTGIKWGFLPGDTWPHYVVANADESEPGTFKDRELLEENPYQFLEGLAIACYAVGAAVGYIYLRGEFWALADALDGHIHELESAGLLGEDLLGTGYALRLYTHRGAGAYICGEESALLESLEGKLGQPRLRPPFPATAGLYGKPTVINNVETLANLPPIVEQGAAWYRTIGTEKSPGTKIFCLSGRVVRPGNYELPLGTPLRRLVYELGGGILDNRPFKALMPAGASSSLIAITDEILDTPMDYEAMTAAGSPLGSASMIIIDDTVDIDWLVNKTVHFFAHESCGKCTPCREGTYWMERVAKRIAEGKGTAEDIDLLDDIAAQIQGKCLCALGEFSTMAVRSGIEKFRADFEARVEREKVPNG